MAEVEWDTSSFNFRDLKREEFMTTTEQFSNQARTFLAACLSATDLTLSVVSVDNFPSSPEFRIRIGRELLIVTGLNGCTWTVTRGAEGTSPAPHPKNSPVVAVLTAGAIRELRAEIEAEIAATVPAEVPKKRTINTTAPLGGGGDLSDDLTLTISNATTESDGALSKEDKTKLDGIETNATHNTLVIGTTTGTAADGGALTSLASSVGEIVSFPGFGTTHSTAPYGDDSRLSDDRTASAIRSATTVVAVSSATAPTAGQVLTATDSAHATWQDLPGAISVAWISSCSDDSTMLATLMGLGGGTRKLTIHCQPAATYHLNSLLPLGGNAVSNVTIVGDPTATIILDVDTNAGPNQAYAFAYTTDGSHISKATTTPYANVAEGSTTIQVNSITSPVISVGSWLYCIAPTDAGWMARVTAICGSSAPFTLTLDRAFPFPWLTSYNSAIHTCTPLENFTIDGKGMTVTGAGNTFCRFWMADNLTIDGLNFVQALYAGTNTPLAAFISLYTGTRNCRARNNRQLWTTVPATLFDVESISNFEISHNIGQGSSDGVTSGLTGGYGILLGNSADGVLLHNVLQGYKYGACLGGCQVEIGTRRTQVIGGKYSGSTLGLCLERGNGMTAIGVTATYGNAGANGQTAFKVGERDAGGATVGYWSNIELIGITAPAPSGHLGNGAGIFVVDNKEHSDINIIAANLVGTANGFVSTCLMPPLTNCVMDIGSAGSNCAVLVVAQDFIGCTIRGPVNINITSPVTRCAFLDCKIVQVSGTCCVGYGSYSGETLLDGCTIEPAGATAIFVQTWAALTNRHKLVRCKFSATAALLNMANAGGTTNIEFNDTDTSSITTINSGGTCNLMQAQQFGATSVAVTTADVILTSAQSATKRIETTGTLTNNRSVITGAWLGSSWIVSNGNSGCYTTTFKATSGDAGVAVAQGKSAILQVIYCGAMVRITADSP